MQMAKKTFPISCITGVCGVAVNFIQGKKNYSCLIQLSILLNVLLTLTMIKMKITYDSDDDNS